MAVGVAAVLVGCSPPQPTPQWQEPTDRIEGHVQLPGSAANLPTALGPAFGGGVLVAEGPATHLTRVRPNGSVAYRHQIPATLVLGAESNDARDLFVGTAGPGAAELWQESRAVVHRYRPDGAPDGEFGTAGVVELSPPPPATTGPWWDDVPDPPATVAHAASYRGLSTWVLVSQVTGSWSMQVTHDHWIAKLDRHGAPDADWGDGGWTHLGRTTLRSAPTSFRAGRMAVAADGSLIAALGGELGVAVGRVSPTGELLAWAPSVSANGGVNPGCDQHPNVDPFGIAVAGITAYLAIAPRHPCLDHGIVALDGDLQPATGFGEGGVLSWPTQAGAQPAIAAIGDLHRSDQWFRAPVIDGSGDLGLLSFDAVGALEHPELPFGVQPIHPGGADVPPLHLWQRHPVVPPYLHAGIAAAHGDALHLAGTVGGSAAPAGVFVMRVRDLPS